MPIRDGLDPSPLDKCGAHCGRCEQFCAKAVEDAGLRAAGWHPIGEAPLEPGLELEGLTVNGGRILIEYLPTGDYLDRWVHPYGPRPLLDLTHWRPLRARLPGPLRRH